MTCDVGNTVFILSFSSEPGASYVVKTGLSEEDCKQMATQILGKEVTWFPKRTGALYLAGYTESGVGNPGFERGFDVSVEEHIIAQSECVETFEYAGNVPANTLFEHTADFVMVFTITTLGADTINIEFRKQDDSNMWILAPNTDGNLFLFEIPSGGFEVRANPGAAAVAVDDQIALKAVGEVLTAYKKTGAGNFTQVWEYASASSYQAEVAGNVAYISAGGAIQDLVVYPANDPCLDALGLA